MTAALLHNLSERNVPFNVERSSATECMNAYRALSHLCLHYQPGFILSRWVYFTLIGLGKGWAGGCNFRCVNVVESFIFCALRRLAGHVQTDN